MSKAKYLIIGNASFNIEETQKIGHALSMKTWKDAGFPSGIIAQAEAQIFPEALEEKEEPKATKKKP